MAKNRNRNQTRMAQRMSQEAIWQDENPQMVGIVAVETAANTFTEGSVTLPMLTPVGRGGKSLVCELLKVIVHMDAPNYINVQNTLTSCQLTKTHQTAMIGIEHAPVIIRCMREHVIVDTGATDATLIGTEPPDPIEYDLTDGAGHGILIPGPALYLGVQGTLNTTAKAASMKIIYRYKEVGPGELVGMMA
jgi:hypothetical protein